MTVWPGVYDNKREAEGFVGPDQSTYRVDLIAFDRNSQPVLLVEVKRQLADDRLCTQAIAQSLHMIQALYLLRPVSFLMLANRENMMLYRRNDTEFVETLCLSTEEVLCVYDPEFCSKQVNEDYMTTLIGSWVDDLILHWKTLHPPYESELRTAGLLPLLEGGAVIGERFLTV